MRKRVAEPYPELKPDDVAWRGREASQQLPRVCASSPIFKIIKSMNSRAVCHARRLAAHSQRGCAQVGYPDRAPSETLASVPSHSGIR